MGWNFKSDHVQPEQRNGQFASAESTLIAAGPPRLSQSNNAAKAVYHVGMIENIGIQQSKQLQRIFEIGSSRSYFVPGRVIGAVNLGRVFYYGPSLLRALYAYYPMPEFVDPTLTDQGTANERLDPNSKLTEISDITLTSVPTIQVSPGEDYFWCNLASDMFNQGTGIAVYFKDSNANLIGAMYMEDCFMQGHQMNVASGSVLIMEGASMQFDRLVPIKITSTSV